VLPAREVVLAAGSIENARLLALSDADQVGLGTGREHTGRWLQDHPVIRTAEVLSASPDLQDLYTGLHRGRVHLFPKIRLAPGQQSASGLPDATASLTHDLVPSALDAVRRIRHREAGADVGAIARGLPGLGRAVWRRYARGLSSGLPVEHVWLDVWLEQPPRTDSRVTLGPNRDAYGLPTASVRWVVGEAERNSSRRLTALIGSELQRLGLGRLAPLPAATDDEAWQHTVADAFHPAGTTRMATEPTDGVVGPDLAVHGVPGLWVLGGSVFPTSGYSNPTLTIVALALRLAARLTVPAAIAQR
jgi:choline dehydrogenase-like flavoprotein